MATTGYSGTPLIKKLGIQQEMKIVLVNAPENYSQLLEAAISQQITTKFSEADFVHLFAVSKKDLTNRFTEIIMNAKPNCIIWI